MSHHLNSGQNQNIRVANESFENVAKFIYLGMTLTTQNNIHDEIKSRLNSGNASYYSVQIFFFLSHIKKKLKIKICKTNFAGYAVWVRNLVSHFEGGT
jgi:hypothetical protein